jgi:hypothetical protein
VGGGGLAKGLGVGGSADANFDRQHNSRRVSTASSGVSSSKVTSPSCLAITAGTAADISSSPIPAVVSNSAADTRQPPLTPAHLQGNGSSGLGAGRASARHPCRSPDPDAPRAQPEDRREGGGQAGSMHISMDKDSQGIQPASPACPGRAADMLTSSVPAAGGRGAAGSAPGDVWGGVSHGSTHWGGGQGGGGPCVPPYLLYELCTHLVPCLALLLSHSCQAMVVCCRHLLSVQLGMRQPVSRAGAVGACRVRCHSPLPGAVLQGQHPQRYTTVYS